MSLVVALTSLSWRRDDPVPPGVPPTLDTTGFDPLIAGALEGARRRVVIQPTSIEAWSSLGMLLLAHELRDTARPCFVEAERLSPQDARWPYFTGLARGVEDPAGALEHFWRAVRLLPSPDTSTPGAWEAVRLRLAETLLPLGRLAEANTLYREVLVHRPGSGPASLGLAKIATTEGRLVEAIPLLESAALDPSTRKSARRLLLALYQRLDRDADVERLAREMPDLPDDAPRHDPYVAQVDGLKTGENTWIDRADECLKTGRFAEAAELLEKTASAYPRSDRALFLLGRARHRLGDHAGAEAVLKQAIARSPEKLEAHLQLGVVYLARGRATEARDAFRTAIRVKPNLPEAWYNLGLSLGGENREQSMAAFREAIRLRPSLIEAYLGLALVLRAEGRAAEASATLNQALALQPLDHQRQRIIDELRSLAPR